MHARTHAHVRAELVHLFAHTARAREGTRKHRSIVPNRRDIERTGLGTPDVSEWGDGAGVLFSNGASARELCVNQLCAAACQQTALVAASKFC